MFSKNIKMKLPEMMNAVQLEKQGGPFVVRSVKVPIPGKGEVLVKMAAAPINPSDLQRINSITDATVLSTFIPGIEGSGTIVAAGEGFIPKLWMGKRVACSSPDPSSGTWAEYMLTKATYCFPLPDAVTDEQGSMLLVNPMTAVAFFDLIKQDKHKAIVNSAAAGALGGMIRLLARKNNIPVINVVRNEEQVKMLVSDGAMYVLNNSDQEFTHRLQSLSEELKATIAFDPIAGGFTQQLLDNLPYGSMVVLYGNLSGAEQGTNLRPLLTENKKLHGFYLVNWMKDNSLLKTLKNLNRVKLLLKNELKVPVQKRFPLDQTHAAIDTYLNNMTGGKVLIVPGL
jgi:NADPH:quinone reductase-like Zn-dependent oxidoreductase